MSANSTSGLGLFQNFFQPQNFTNFSANLQHGPEQMMRGLARWQIEVQGLAVRRAQAYLELPGRMSQCRTPQDLMAEQQRFLQTCVEQYSNSTRAIMGAWAQMLQFPGSAVASGSEKDAQRDYLSFPEPRVLNGTGAKDEAAQHTSRKVA